MCVCVCVCVMNKAGTGLGLVEPPYPTDPTDLFMRRLSSLRVEFPWRAWPRDTPPVSPMELLLASRQIKEGA